MKKYRIGRHPDNDIVLDFPQVSGTHAELTVLGNFSLLIEDLGSANGTFVNQLQVKRCVLKPGDEVKIANIRLDLSPYFRLPASEQPDASNPNDYTKAFAQLEEVYLHYEKMKRAISRRGKWKKTILRAGLSLIPFVGSAIAIIVCESISEEEKLKALDVEFRASYVCPKCKTFLGYSPFQVLAARKSCMHCNAVWVK
ncbi:MAG: FHA domain-containing protein [Cytophagales bacterium]|nr:FHA domain-containing protein [Bernardetiaceae bacterium]MDW8210430.1 FHA domain-containing protein [Cytophagales bacterium]